MIVKLDDVRFPGNGGVVVAHVSDVSEFQGYSVDKDGCRAADLRLWVGNYPVGTRVCIARLPEVTRAT